MGLGGVAIAVPPYVIHPKTAVLGRAGGGVNRLTVNSPKMHTPPHSYTRNKYIYIYI